MLKVKLICKENEQMTTQTSKSQTCFTKDTDESTKGGNSMLSSQVTSGGPGGPGSDWKGNQVGLLESCSGCFYQVLVQQVCSVCANSSHYMHFL